MDSKIFQKKLDSVFYVFTITVQFWTLSGRVCGQVLNALVCESGRSYWENTFSLEKSIFGSKAFSEPERTKCLPFRNTLRPVCQNCTLHLQRIILKRAYRFKSFLLFIICGFWTKKFQPVRNNFRQWRKDCLLCVHRNILRQFVFWKKSSANFLGL